MFWLGSVFASTVANEQLLNTFFKKVRLCQRIGRFIIFFFRNLRKIVFFESFLSLNPYRFAGNFALRGMVEKWQRNGRFDTKKGLLQRR